MITVSHLDTLERRDTWVDVVYNSAHLVWPATCGHFLVKIS